MAKMLRICHLTDACDAHRRAACEPHDRSHCSPSAKMEEELASLPATFSEIQETLAKRLVVHSAAVRRASFVRRRETTSAGGALSQDAGDGYLELPQLYRLDQVLVKAGGLRAAPVPLLTIPGQCD